MTKDLFKYFGLAIILYLFQFLVLSNINLMGYANSYVYILILLLLPYNTPRWSLLLIGFAVGFVADYFSNSLGLHTSAMLVLAYMRPLILKRWSFRSNQDERGAPEMINTSMEWFLVYVIVAVFIHHTFMFFLEAFTLGHFALTLLRVLLSTILSSIFIFIIEVIRTRNKRIA